MSKFQFNLQSLYNIKILMEDLAKNKLSKALKELNKQEMLLDQYLCDRSSCITELSAKCKDGVPSFVLKSYNLYLTQLNEKITKQKEVIKLAKKNVDTVREELIKATQEKEMFEKLKERKYAAYLYEISKKEQRITDELVSYRKSLKSAML
ncbi:MAG TPA: flagellar export protein FliJ [Clostridiaceae bacterium]|nr:flagellar export protein FliJ [Clostridiaceae bacterium]